ncbi:MAG: acyl carrier protein [Clostridia bacterium]|nr:acyl carrier protein [Clostridia bacterium]
MSFEKIKKIIAEQLSVDEDSITMETDLVNDLKADSLDVVELVMEVEQTFNIDIPDEVLKEVKTIKDIVDYIDNNKK